MFFTCKSSASFYEYKAMQLCQLSGVKKEPHSRRVFRQMAADMRPAFYVSLLVLGWAVSLSLAAGNLESKFEHILNDPIRLQSYANCFLDRDICEDSESRTLKRLLPEFIASSCARCSVSYKKMACRVIAVMQLPEYQELWRALLLKYDPYRQHKDKLENFRQECILVFGIPA